MSWSSALSVGVKEFDEQHKVLVTMVNDLHAAMMGGKGNQVLGPILGSLIEYTQTHFAGEERLLAQHGYGALAHHRAEHAKLVQQVVALQQKFQTGKGALTIEVLSFLKDWLVTHIQGEDRQYGAFLNGRGVH
jgi:hemerythrin